MTRRIRVSAVSYLNTAPFVYGLKVSGILDRIDLTLDYPSECARKLMSDESDIGLIPVAAIPSLKEHHILTDYCLGATGPVRTTVLLSNSPIDSIEKIYLDYQSKTSITLVKVLANHLWKITPVWLPLTPEIESKDIDPYEGVVIIGDRVFDFESDFKFKYDLANEWIKLTGLPFVFATWTSNKPIDDSLVKDFNFSFNIGINNIPAAIDFYAPRNISRKEAEYYLQNNLSFILDNPKRDGIKLFWSLARELTPG